MRHMNTPPESRFSDAEIDAKALERFEGMLEENMTELARLFFHDAPVTAEERIAELLEQAHAHAEDDLIREESE